MQIERDIAEAVVNWQAPPRPQGLTMQGRFARLARLDADAHAADLHRANSASAAIWDYLPYGPFASTEAYSDWTRDAAASMDPMFYAIQALETGQFCGVASYLRITPDTGSIEVGHIAFSPELQRTRAATEAMYLMMRWAFEAGYRRYEWKCNAQNLGSRRAAERFGFSYEGVFRQAAIIKGRNRDTAWFAVIDSEWPALKQAFDQWLAPSNFTDDGTQIKRLSDLTSPLRYASDPALHG